MFIFLMLDGDSNQTQEPDYLTFHADWHACFFQIITVALDRSTEMTPCRVAAFRAPRILCSSNNCSEVFLMIFAASVSRSKF